MLTASNRAPSAMKQSRMEPSILSRRLRMYQSSLINFTPQSPLATAAVEKGDAPDRGRPRRRRPTRVPTHVLLKRRDRQGSVDGRPQAGALSGSSPPPDPGGGEERGGDRAWPLPFSLS